MQRNVEMMTRNMVPECVFCHHLTAKLREQNKGIHTSMNRVTFANFEHTTRVQHDGIAKQFVLVHKMF